MSLIIEAAQFAAFAHGNQNRKYGHSDRPYITHPARVAAKVCLVAGATEEMVAAAWLHDVIEDCGVTPLALSDFPHLTVMLVKDLTNPSKQHPELSRVERKKMDREHIANCCWQTKVIKLCDRIDNVTESLDDPETPVDFIQTYLIESQLLLEALRCTCEPLERELAQLLEKANA